MSPLLLLPLLPSLVLLLRTGGSSAQSESAGFHLVQGSLCIRSEYIVEVATAGGTPLACAFECSGLPDCQAFERPVGGGPCRLFVFDMCSRPLADCGACNRTGDVFVRGRPGLPPGRLCPDTYGDARCGLRYRLASGPYSWAAFATLASAEPGLAGFADALTADELSWVLALSVRHSSSFFVSGAQLPGSPEPAGGFRWSRCNRTVDAGFFWPGDPDNRPGEDFVGVYFAGGGLAKGLVDVPVDPYNKALFMCVSPFD